MSWQSVVLTAVGIGAGVIITVAGMYVYVIRKFMR